MSSTSGENNGSTRVLCTCGYPAPGTEDLSTSTCGNNSPTFFYTDAVITKQLRNRGLATSSTRERLFKGEQHSVLSQAVIRGIGEEI